MLNTKQLKYFINFFQYAYKTRKNIKDLTL